MRKKILIELSDNELVVDGIVINESGNSAFVILNPKNEEIYNILLSNATNLIKELNDGK